MFICYTISEDRTGSQEIVTGQRLSALGARCRKRKLQEFSVREETDLMEGVLSGGYPRGGGAGASSTAGGFGMEASNPTHPFTDCATSGGEKNPIIYVRSVGSPGNLAKEAY
jgi:hypothetical protein